MSNDTDEPKAIYLTDRHAYRWGKGVEGVEIRFERMTEERGGDVTAYATYLKGDPNNPTEITGGKLNLASLQTRKSTAKDLDAMHPLAEDLWLSRLNKACIRSIKEYLEGASTLLNMDDVVVDRSQALHLVQPIVPDHMVTIIYGDSGTGKSTFVLALLLTVATGHPFLNIKPARVGPVIYFDWEDHEGPLRARMEALCAGAGIDFPKNVHYRAVDRPLATGEARIKREVEQTKAILVAVDSLGMAMGGDPSDNNLVIPAANALRRLRVPALAIHHLSAAQAESNDLRAKQRPYGSKYAGAAARSTWLYESLPDADGEESHLYLFHTKTNHGPKSRPLSWAAHIETDAHGFPSSIAYSPRSASDYFDRIRAEKTTEEKTVKDVLEDFFGNTGGFEYPLPVLVEKVSRVKGQVSEQTVRNKLGDLVKSGYLATFNGSEGRIVWALKSARSDVF